MLSKKKNDKILMSLAQIKFRRISTEEKEKMRNANGRIEISDLPNLARVITMTHAELLEHLYMCPASQFFGNREFKES